MKPMFPPTSEYQCTGARRPGAFTWCGKPAAFTFVLGASPVQVRGVSHLLRWFACAECTAAQLALTPIEPEPFAAWYEGMRDAALAAEAVAMLVDPANLVEPGQIWSDRHGDRYKVVGPNLNVALPESWIVTLCRYPKHARVMRRVDIEAKFWNRLR